MSENAVKIHAFVSYRHKHPDDIDARDKLEQICANAGIVLIYDKNGTEEGSSLITFMKDLSAARCVFLFLSPAYFQSAYTLYELVSLHKQAELDRRFIRPVRVSIDMVTYQRTAAEQYWKKDESIRQELSRLLKQSDHEEVWKCIVAAWDAIVFPFLDELHTALENGKPEFILNKEVEALQKAIRIEKEKATWNLQQKVISEVVYILKKQRIPIDRLASECNLPPTATPDEIAKHLVETQKPMVGRALGILTKISLQQEKQLAAFPERWNDYLFDIEQVSGWLLITSVDPSWWFLNEIRMKRAVSEGITNAFSLEHPAYIEVIISRDLLQQANYCLDEYGEIRPGSNTYDIMLFDAVSKDATDIALLSEIYKDLRRAERTPQDVQQLLKSIQLTARSLHTSRDGRVIYYIVSKSYLDLLQTRDWFVETERKLAGYLQFVCCESQPSPYDQQPCQEEQDLLLDQVANILRLRNPKRTKYD